jgi:hypothetical protein
VCVWAAPLFHAVTRRYTVMVPEVSLSPVTNQRTQPSS